MVEIALARINSFANVAERTNEQPEEPIFVLTPYQLRDLIKEATQPLQDEVSSLKAIVTNQDEKIRALEATQDTQAGNQLIQLRLINDLREATKKEPGKTETSRAEKIAKYLKDRPDHKATFETLKGHLGIDNDRLGKAIKALVSSGKYAIIKTPGDKRKRTLILLPI
jgi:hypothetical protein